MRTRWRPNGAIDDPDGCRAGRTMDETLEAIIRGPQPPAATAAVRAP